MPIQKGGSKDLPGKDGYSYNDRKKILHVLATQEDEPEDNGDECFKNLLDFVIAGIAILNLVRLYIS